MTAFNVLQVLQLGLLGKTNLIKKKKGTQGLECTDMDWFSIQAKKQFPKYLTNAKSLLSGADPINQNCKVSSLWADPKKKQNCKVSVLSGQIQ